MKLYLLSFLLCLLSLQLVAHSGLDGKIVSELTKIPIPNTYIKILNAENKITYSDQEGKFEFKFLPAGKYFIEFSHLGYKTQTDTIVMVDNVGQELNIELKEDIFEMPSVNITARKELSQTTISALDFKLRTHNTSQDLLRLVPGLFIAQHAGGGKAEQIFIRGFDVDHGTDVAVSVDGMPVNMVSHAHGQGYADLHFVIPETIENMSFSKGPYDAKTGNLNTAAAVRFQTKNYLQKNTVKYEVGSFGLHRGLIMLNVLPYKIGTARKHSAYIASEYNYSKGYFENPQNLKRFNIFGKYNGELSDHTNLSISISTFASSWKASGQIPQRAIDQGKISWFGAIDPTEGGKTSRTNVNATLTHYLNNSATIKNQLFYVNNNFDLYSNFTFFLHDSINSDEIRQYEKRNMFGYNGSYSNDVEVGAVTVKGTIGLGFRSDKIKDINLDHTVKRRFLSAIKRGDVFENNANGYLDLNFLLSEKFTLNTGVRYDLFKFQYEDKLLDTINSSTTKGIASPKLNIYYKATKDIQIYASAGYGFHSNDTRVTAEDKSITQLPRAKSVDLGTNFKLMKKIFVNAAIWHMTLESEYVYGGDNGFSEPGPASTRSGLELSARYQMIKWLFLDCDLNLTNPRYKALPENENFVPLAPRITSVGGIGINAQNGISGSLRYRYLGPRPAIEDNSIVASGYYIMDAVINYQKKFITVSVSAENLLNKKWREAQFATESKLQTETTSVNEIHFTPGTPFFIKGSVSVTF